VTREQLEHAIRAACYVSDDSEIWIFGSQAILGEFPKAPESVCTSIEIDVQPKNRPDNTDIINGALGELSLFHQTHGFYVHSMPIDSASLPAGWEKRVIAVRDEITTKNNTGWCVEVHDLCASKLVAYREKDRDFVRTLLIEKMIVPQTLKKRIGALPVEKALRNKLALWVEKTCEEL